MSLDISTNSALPHFFIEYNPHAPQKNRVVEDAVICTSGLLIRTQNYHIAFHHFENETDLLCIVGCPILGDKINPQGIWEAVLSSNSGPRFWHSLNGEFLIIHLDKAKRQLQIINDRFTSIPLYYAAFDHKFLASVFYNDFWLRLKSENRLSFNEPAFFEFLWLQRVLGSKTYDNLSRYLPAATCLTVDGQTTTLQSYWRPSFEKTSESLSACAIQLGNYLKQSIKRKTSDGTERCGLFLSGGTDSRTVLAAFDQPPVCFTLAMSKNNEYRVAHEVAAMKNAKHVFIQLDPDPYSKNLEALLHLAGGVYTFDHALFFGFEDLVAPHAEVVFHGHGIDYMFQGMYVPSVPIYIGSRRTFFSRLRPIGEDFVSDYLSNIPYRLKGVDLLQYVKPAYRDQMYEALRESVREIMADGEDFCQTPYDLWEYMLIHALSRHYPHPNLSSMATCAEQRTVTFDNDVFDLYLSLPTHYRLNAKMARMTLKYLNQELAKVRTANTNLRADWSPWQKQAYRFWDKLLRVSRLRKKTKFWAPAEERTWPDRDRVIRSQPKLKQAALEVCDSEALATLSFLDMDAISAQIPKWLEQPKGGGAFMIFLITLDRFLKQ